MIDLLSSPRRHALAPVARPAREAIALRRPHVLITGGAGFVGTNLALALLELGCRVCVLDNLSRSGVERNAETLARAARAGRGSLQLWTGDVRDPAGVKRAVAGTDAVFHLAAQVAVTTSFQDPAGDFETNARGTLNVLEAVRASGRAVPLLFTSTNKVYGHLEGIELLRLETRYRPRRHHDEHRGVSERAIDLQSPYGCSKGCADQYVLDYVRSFGIQATVFRMSCIFGPHQHGNADQGWVAHFLTRLCAGERITIYGDGRQVRDLLFADDLVQAFLEYLAAPARMAGRAFNVGGGPSNARSLLEILEAASAIAGREPELAFEPWRPGDQRWYVSDTTLLRRTTGWRPRVGVDEGLTRLWRWLAGTGAGAPVPARKVGSGGPPCAS